MTMRWGRTPTRTLGLLLAWCAVLFAGVIAATPDRAAAAVPTCSAAGIGITALHGPVFYIDPGNSPAMTSAYAGYQVTNQTGAALADTWVQLSAFTGGAVALGTGQPAAEQVPSLGNGASKSLFWYLTASGASSSAQNHTVTVYSHQPGLANASVLCTTTGGFGSVATTIGANANKITSVTLSTATPTIGSTFSITVNGNTGTIGQGPPAPSADPYALWTSPSSISGWPAAAYRLVGTKLSISPDGTAPAQDNVDTLHLTGLGSASRDYTATYTFQATGFTAGNSTLLPVEQISSGTQIKHTGSYPTTIPAIAPATDDLALSVAATPTHLPTGGGTVSYTATIAGTTGASLDSFTLAAPADASVVSGSARYNTTTLPDPVSDSSGNLVFQGPFTTTAGTDTLTFQLAYGPTPGPRQATLTGTVGAATIDTTPGNLTDNSPASATIWVNTPPVAAPDSATVAANSAGTAVPVLANDTDVDGDPLTVTGVTQPAHGTTTFSATGVRYTPSAGYTGPDTFTYTVADGNGATTTGTVTVAVTDVPGQVVSFPQPPDATALSDVAVSASSDAGLPIAYSTITPAVCSVDSASGAVTLRATGTCTIQADQPGDAGHAAAAPVQRSFAVAPAPQALTFPQPPDLPLAAATTSVSATSDAGLAVHYAAVTDVVCAVDPDSGAVQLLGTGTCTLEASQPGDSLYAPATPLRRSFAVTTTGQSITFDRPADALVSDGPLALDASSSSGLAVTFTSATTDVCTTSPDGAVDLLAAGTCTIQADQGGSAAYSAAPPVRRSFAVAAAPVTSPQTLSLAPIPDTELRAGTVSASASSDSGLPVSYASTTPATCTADTASGVVTLLSVGTCTVEADQPGDDTHAAADPAARSFEITRSGQQLSFPALPDEPLLAATTTVAASSDSGLPVSYSSATADRCTVDPSSGEVLLLATGECTLEARQDGSADYLAAAPVQESFAIVRSDQSIDFPALPDGRVGDPVGLTAASGSGLPVTYTAGPESVCRLDDAGTGLVLTGPGTCTVEARQPGDAVYLPASAQAGLTVLPALIEQTITFPTLPDTAVTAAGVQAPAAASSRLPVVENTRTPEICDVSTTGTLTLRATGICTIQADQPGDGSYAPAAPVSMSFAVVRAGQAVDFPAPADIMITGQPVVTATATSGLPVSYAGDTPTTCSVAPGGAVTLLAAGTCTITAAQAGSQIYAPADPVSRSFSITLLPQSITLTAPATEDVSIGSVPVTAASDAGLDVVVTASPAAVCTMAGPRTVRLLGSGRCALTASAEGDRSHRAAEPVSATIAVTAQASDKTYTLPPAPPIAPGGPSGINLDVLSGAPGQTLVGVSQPSQGHVTVTGQRVALTVPDGYKGTETFTYTTKDASGALHTATVTIVVPNSPPTVRGTDSATVAGSGRSLAVQLADPNHDRLSVTVGPHQGASVTVSGHDLRVVPDLSFSGDLAVPVTVSDGDGGTAHTTIHVRVSPRPTPSADRYLIPSGTRLVWHPVPTTAARYAVTVNGSAGCVTAAASCTIGKLLGAAARVTVTVLGRDRTLSAQTTARPHSGRPQLAGTVYFATDSAVVSPYQAGVVRALTRRLTADGFTAMAVVGYTDSRGSAWYNLGLSQRRAQAVSRLVHLQTRVSVHLAWHGEGAPAATNGTARGQALNRRVELWVY